MTEFTLFSIIGIFIVTIILIIHIYDRHLVKQIKTYEKRLEKKGIFKRHFIKSKSPKKKLLKRGIRTLG